MERSALPLGLSKSSLGYARDDNPPRDQASPLVISSVVEKSHKMAWETKMARGIKKMFNKTLQLKKREYGRTKCIFYIKATIDTINNLGLKMVVQVRQAPQVD